MSYEIYIATTIIQRLRGLVGVDKGVILMLCPCCDIHTFTLREDIDVAFLDQRGMVLKSQIHTKPFRHMRVSHAVAVMERYSDDAPWFHEGEKLVIAKGRIEVLR